MRWPRAPTRGRCALRPSAAGRRSRAPRSRVEAFYFCRCWLRSIAQPNVHKTHASSIVIDDSAAHSTELPYLTLMLDWPAYMIIFYTLTEIEFILRDFAIRRKSAAVLASVGQASRN